MLIANVTTRSAGRLRWLALTSALALLATVAGCKSSTSTYDDPAMLSVVSGGNQTVTINPGGLTDLPLPVVIRVQRNGNPVAYADLNVVVSSAVASVPARNYVFFTGPDGSVPMRLQVNDTPGQFNIDVTFLVWESLSESKVLGTLRVTGTAVN